MSFSVVINSTESSQAEVNSIVTDAGVFACLVINVAGTDM